MLDNIEWWCQTSKYRIDNDQYRIRCKHDKALEIPWAGLRTWGDFAASSQSSHLCHYDQCHRRCPHSMAGFVKGFVEQMFSSSCSNRPRWSGSKICSWLKREWICLDWCHGFRASSRHFVQSLPTPTHPPRAQVMPMAMILPGTQHDHRQVEWHSINGISPLEQEFARRASCSHRTCYINL